MSRVLLRTSRRAFGTAAATPKGGDAHHSKPSAAAHDSHDHHDDHHHGEHHDHHDLHHHDAASLHSARVAKQRLFGRTLAERKANNKWEDWELISYIGFGGFCTALIVLWYGKKIDETASAWAKRELALRKQERKAAEDAAAHATQVVGAVGAHESNKKTASH